MFYKKTYIVTCTCKSVDNLRLLFLYIDEIFLVKFHKIISTLS